MTQEDKEVFLEAVCECMEREKKQTIKLTKLHRAAEYSNELEYIRYWQIKGYITVVPNSHKVSEIEIKITSHGKEYVRGNDCSR